MVNKLPRKETLLKGQEPPKKETPIGESPEVRKAREDAEVAAQIYKQKENEIRTKLLEDGYKSIEEAKSDILNKHEESDKLLAHAQEQEKSINEQLEKIEEEKQKILNAYTKVKETERLVNTRLEDAIKLENARQAETDNHNAWKGELTNMIEYHKQNIQPCRKALLLVSKAIYNWADTLNYAKVDFMGLYNYIGKVMRLIDNYTEREGKTIPDDLFTKDKEQLNSTPASDESPQD